MYRRLITIAAATAILFAALAAGASMMTVEGTVEGYTCAVMGKSCPVDAEDPVVALERAFVVVQPDGSFYLVPNIDRAILARYITHKVKVTGEADSKYKSVTADSLAVRRGDQWKVVWSPEIEAQMRRQLYGTSR